MATILPYRGVWPTIAPDAYIAPTAVIVGNVTIEAQASVWFGAVIRGDTAPIRIGARTNIQDNSVLHADEGLPCTIGADCSVGHSAIVHGATVGYGVLIGMHATVLNAAHIEDGSIVAAGALIGEGKRFEAGQLIVGVPGKVLRAVTDAERERMRNGVRHYIDYANEYRQAQRVAQTKRVDRLL